MTRYSIFVLKVSLNTDQPTLVVVWWYCVLQLSPRPAVNSLMPVYCRHWWNCCLPRLMSRKRFVIVF